MLQLRNIKKTYETSKGVKTEALKNINLDFPSKGMVFILGKSGSGKSTLLNIIGGLDSANEGEIIMLEKSSSNFTQADYDAYRNTYIGFIFQDFQLIEMYTIHKNIELALQLQQHDDKSGIIDDILDKVGLKGFGNRYPNELSGGQKQRVAIARALVKKPQILMADEPTGALDSDTGKEIFDVLKQLSEEQLVIVVSHDRDSAKEYADRIIELKDGEVMLDDNEMIEEESTNSFQAIASHLPLKASFQLGISCLTHKKLRMIFTIILTSFALITFGLSDALGDFNDINAHKKAMEEQSETFVGIQHQLVSEDSMNHYAYLPIEENIESELKTLTNTSIAKEYDSILDALTTSSLQIMADDKNTQLYDSVAPQQFYPVEMSSFEDLNIDKTIGAYPKTNQEIAISSYLADLIIRNGVMDENGDMVYPVDYQDIIDSKVKLNVFNTFCTISGIANYDLSEFANIKDNKDNILADENSQSYRKLRSMASLKYNKIYVIPNFMESLNTKVNTTLKSTTGVSTLTMDGSESYLQSVMYLSNPITFHNGSKVITKQSLEKNEFVASPSDILQFGYGERYYKLKDSDKSIEELKKDYIQNASRYIGKEGKFEYSDAYGNKVEISQDMKIIGFLMPSDREFLETFDHNSSSIVNEELIKDHVLPSVYVRQLLVNASDQNMMGDILDQYNNHKEYTSNTFITPDIIQIQSIAEVFSQVFLYVSIAFFLFAAALMMNFIIISISYRKRDIGILRAIGARSKDVLKIFIWEGAILAMISYVIASISMYVLAEIVNSFAMDRIGILISPIIVTIRQPIVLLAMVLIVCIIACFIPVMKISRQTPIDAIKKQ